MKYLEDAMNVKVAYNDWQDQPSLPYLLTDRYKFQMVLIDSIQALFVYPKGEMEPISTIKKHFSMILKSVQCPVVLVIDKCTARQRKTLICDRLPFIVENKQIYLPFLGTLLEENFYKETNKDAQLLPSAQLLLFYYIYYNKKELAMSPVSERLQLSPMSVSRAVKQLEKIGLISTYKIGVNKIITSDFYGKELYEKADSFLRSPVKKQGYIDRFSIGQTCKAGILALSEYSMLNPPKVDTFAVEGLQDTNFQLEKNLTDADTQQCIQVWTYNPQILANNGCVDILSLHQSLKNEADERIQSELDKLLEDFWENYNGKRN